MVKEKHIFSFLRSALLIFKWTSGETPPNENEKNNILVFTKIASCNTKLHNNGTTKTKAKEDMNLIAKEGCKCEV